MFDFSKYEIKCQYKGKIKKFYVKQRRAIYFDKKMASCYFSSNMKRKKSKKFTGINFPELVEDEKCVKTRMRLNVIYALNSGLTIKDVSEMYHIHPVTVSRWKKIFIQKGVEGLKVKSRKKKVLPKKKYKITSFSMTEKLLLQIFFLMNRARLAKVYHSFCFFF